MTTQCTRHIPPHDVTTRFSPRGRLGTCRRDRMNGFTCGRLLECSVTNTGLRGFAEAAGSQSETKRVPRGKRERARDRVRDVHLFQMAATVFGPKEICKTYSGEPCVLFYRSLLPFTERLGVWKEFYTDRCDMNKTVPRPNKDRCSRTRARPLNQHCAKHKESL